MYLFKNAFTNITRSIGRNVLIGIMLIAVIICTCIALSINKASNNLVNSYIDSNPLEISLQVNMNELRGASNDEKNNFQSITVDDVKNYADSDLVKDYYYTLESSLSSDSVDPVSSTMTRPDGGQFSFSEENDSNDFGGGKKTIVMGNMGSFRITAYSNFAYLSDFESGTKKIKDGSMVTGSSEENEIVISDALAGENELSVGDEISFYLPGDEEKIFTYKIIGIYQDNSNDSSNNFMGMDALSSSNQMYANLNSLTEILNETETDNSQMFRSDGLSALFYLNDNEDLEAFRKEVSEKGLSNYYTVTTNEDEITATLGPIKNLSTFSVNFLVVILAIAVVIISVLNLLNIKNRKYEIGVLRAIGMNKLKVTVQFVLEIFIISLFSLVVGTTIGMIASQPVTNKMLENEIHSYEEKSANIENNFGDSEFQISSGRDGGSFRNGPILSGNRMSNVDYVNSLKVSVDFITIIQLFAVVIGLTVISAGIASSFINKYNPNKILQNRS